MGWRAVVLSGREVGVAEREAICVQMGGGWMTRECYGNMVVLRGGGGCGLCEAGREQCIRDTGMRC